MNAADAPLVPPALGLHPAPIPPGKKDCTGCNGLMSINDFGISLGGNSVGKLSAKCFRHTSSAWNTRSRSQAILSCSDLIAKMKSHPEKTPEGRAEVLEALVQFPPRPAQGREGVVFGPEAEEERSSMLDWLGASMSEVSLSQDYHFTLQARKPSHTTAGRPLSYTSTYKCTQSITLEKEKVPHLDVDKRRDFKRMKRFECDGTFSITATPSTPIVKISYNHQCNHEPYYLRAIYAHHIDEEESRVEGGERDDEGGVEKSKRRGR
ncbi:hypothetical protein BDY24DRAFT_388364 [Mrakia frigida]|uniref:uncharacterized protein n=1 Tax=Mrakia frigida TaxID=29902 RepID=UPI003FCC09DA